MYELLRFTNIGYSRWSLVWKTWKTQKYQRIWQLWRKCQGIDQKSRKCSEKILSYKLHILAGMLGVGRELETYALLRYMWFFQQLSVNFLQKTINHCIFSYVHITRNDKQSKVDIIRIILLSRVPFWIVIRAVQAIYLCSVSSDHFALIILSHLRTMRHARRNIFSKYLE